MSATLGRSHTVEIEAPDGASAIALEHRLVNLAPSTVWRRGHWTVGVKGVHSVEAVQAEVKAWLREAGEVSTTIRVDGRPVAVTASRRPRHHATNFDFIG
jgi:hypothetical protein